MNLLKFLWSASESATLRIIVLSVVNGLAGGLLLILIPNGALAIFAKGNYLFYAVSLPVTVAVFLVTRHLSQKKTEHLAEKALENMVLQITNTVRHMELPEFEGFNPSEIILSIARAQSITSAATKNMESLQAYITLFVGWLYILYISPVFALFVLLVRFLLILIQEMFVKIIRGYVQLQMKEEKGMFTAFRNHLFGFKELKFNRKKSEEIFNCHLLPRIDENRRIRVKSSRYGAELLIISILASLLVMLACTVFSGSFSSGDVMRILIILFFTLQNDMLINASRQSIAEGSVALARLGMLFQGDSLRGSGEDLEVTSGNKGDDEFNEILMSDICFTYPAKGEEGFSIIIDDLSIESGKILFIVGGNGSGKSTLLKVLTGLYPPERGMVRIDGRPVDMSEHRDLFSGVFADFHLFDRFYGMEEVNKEEVEELLDLTGLTGKTRYRETGFSTLELSTGQRKRLALVIAMMEDRPVFVFDEWAADQDPHFRHYFYETILPSLKEKGKTVIAITHDDRYFHVADEVIRIDYGRIAEKWRPDRDKALHPLFSKPEKALTIPSAEKAPVYPGQKQKIPPKPRMTEEQKGFFAQMRNMFQEERESVKRVLFFLPLFALSLVSLVVILIHIPEQQIIEGSTYLWFIVMLCLMVVTFRNLQKYFFNAVENRIMNLRIKVMDHVRNTDLETLNQVGAERIYTALTSDIRAISETTDIILLCFQGGLRTVMIYFYVAYLYPPAGALMVVLTSIGAALYISNHTKMIRLFELVRYRQKKLFESVNHLIHGFKELKLSNRKSNDFYERSLRKEAEDLRELKTDSVGFYIRNATITYGFWKGILLVMILALPFAGIPAATLPVVVGLVITMPLRQVIDRYSQFHMAYMSIRRLMDFETMMKGITREPEPASDEETACPGVIRYDNISYVYRTRDARPFSIGPMSLSFSAGEVVFITGGNGSGKSTLLNVMTGLYPADSGMVYLDGRAVDIRSYRELFSPIFTDFHLFDALYGIKDPDQGKINELLRVFQLDKRVKWINGKFSTLDLSTGQRKRMALLTTILEDKPVYIFDEWAADQDPHFREYFYMKLLPDFKSQGKTVIAVTHDDRYFHTADRVLHLDYGQLSPG
ncbi:MAG: cyclic peptide export ABC transporter [Desulfobacterales bacterium]|nr:cyclic peptide export ABC transporter [Desulfobacterales bacterium]